jgi:hypothetical protein
MTCDTSEVHGRGVSFALSEAELVWQMILSDSVEVNLRPVYGNGQRWQNELKSPVLLPPTRMELRPYLIPMVGVYPARGCPFNCNFCSVVKIAGRKVRSQFFAPEDILAKMLCHRWKAHWLVNASVGLGYAAFARLAASWRMHPME